MLQEYKRLLLFYAKIIPMKIRGKKGESGSVVALAHFFLNDENQFEEPRGSSYGLVLLLVNQLETNLFKFKKDVIVVYK